MATLTDPVDLLAEAHAIAWNHNSLLAIEVDRPRYGPINRLDIIGPYSKMVITPWHPEEQRPGISIVAFTTGPGAWPMYGITISNGTPRAAIRHLLDSLIGELVADALELAN